MNSIFLRGISVLSSPFRVEVLRNCVINCNFRPITYPTAVVSCNRFYSTSGSEVSFVMPVRIEELRQKYKKPVDWLPFEWHRRRRHNPFENSGDLVKELEYDPSWPKPDFELSEELKTASEDVKHIFSLATASKPQIKEVVQRNILKKIQRHPNDFNSLEVRIALYTIRIRSLFHHQREIKKDRRGGRVALYILINRRNRMVKQLYRMDRDRFNWLIQELKLEYTPKRLGGRHEKYCKKWDLRRLTRAYCKKVMTERKAAYHEELKREQADFLKEKEEILAWIEQEEKELANLTI